MKSFAIIALASALTLVTAQTYPPPDTSSISMYNHSGPLFITSGEIKC